VTRFAAMEILRDGVADGAIRDDVSLSLLAGFVSTLAGVHSLLRSHAGGGGRRERNGPAWWARPGASYHRRTWGGPRGCATATGSSSR
jgi:hypothetical protein